MTRVLLTALATALTLTSVAAAGRAGSAQQAGAVSAWNAIAQAETTLLRPTAHGQMRGMAMVQGAVYDAVNAIDRSRKPYLLDVDEVRAGRLASQDAAAATAAYHVLRAITPETETRGSRHRLHGDACVDSGRAARAGRRPGR